MQKFVKAVKNFMASEDGPTAVEYAVMLALIVVVCLTVVQSLGGNASKTFSSVNAQLAGTTTSS